MTPSYVILLLVGLVLVFFATAVVRFLLARRTAATRMTVPSGAPADLATGGELQLGAGGDPTPPPKLKITAADLMYGAAMLVGILAKEVWDGINETGTLRVRGPRLIAALIVSPIVYVAVYSRFTQDSINLLGLAIAFQNGFFWQAVFRTAQAGAEGGGGQQQTALLF